MIASPQPLPAADRAYRPRRLAPIGVLEEAAPGPLKPTLEHLTTVRIGQ